MKSKSDLKITDILLIEKWLLSKSNITKSYYSRIILSFLEKNPNLLIKDISNKHIDEFLNSKDISSGSRETFLNTISSLLSFAQSEGYISLNQAVAVTHNYEKTNPNYRSVSQENVDAMINSQNERNGILISVLFETGAKVDEICSLKVNDFGLRNELAYIHIKNRLDLIRTVPIKNDLYRRLKTFWEKNHYSNSDFFIKSRKLNGPLNPSQVLRIIKGAAQNAGLNKNISPSWIRHSRAIIARQSGMSLEELRLFLGLESLEAVLIYSDIMPKSSSLRSSSQESPELETQQGQQNF